MHVKWIVKLSIFSEVCNFLNEEPNDRTWAIILHAFPTVFHFGFAWLLLVKASEEKSKPPPQQRKAPPPPRVILVSNSSSDESQTSIKSISRQSQIEYCNNASSETTLKILLVATLHNDKTFTVSSANLSSLPHPVSAAAINASQSHPPLKKNAVGSYPPPDYPRHVIKVSLLLFESVFIYSDVSNFVIHYRFLL